MRTRHPTKPPGTTRFSAAALATYHGAEGGQFDLSEVVEFRPIRTASLRILGPAGADQFRGGRPCKQLYVAVSRHVRHSYWRVPSRSLRSRREHQSFTSSACRHVWSTPSRILNVPLNLFYDLINIPANELNAIQELSNALLFGGPWFVPSATNVWGFDVADPPKAEALVEMLIPFQALSEPLAQQLTGVYEAELPTNPDCATFFCTGLFDLLHGWFNVPLSQLVSGYYFDPSSPGSVDPLGAVDGEFGFAGTQTIDGLQDLYPWAGTTFTLNLFEPFTEFWNSLTAAPSTTPIEPLPDVFQVLTHLAEGIFVALDPFLPGGPYDPSDAGPIRHWLDLARLRRRPASGGQHSVVGPRRERTGKHRKSCRRHGHNAAGPSGVNAGQHVLTPDPTSRAGARRITM